MDILIKFLVGGFVVSTFAVLGDLLKPKSFAGLFGAAPSIALATITLTVFKDGKIYAAIEARSMVFGAISFFLYACAVSWMLLRKNMSAKMASLLAMFVWFGGAFGLWFAVLR
jgi:hypothetical protein